MNAVTLAMVAKKWFGFEFDRTLDEAVFNRGLDLVKLTKTVDYGETVSGTFGGASMRVRRCESCFVYLEEVRPGVVRVYLDGSRDEETSLVFDSNESRDEISFVDFMVTALRKLKLENFVLNLAWEPPAKVDSADAD